MTTHLGDRNCQPDVLSMCPCILSNQHKKFPNAINYKYRSCWGLLCKGRNSWNLSKYQLRPSIKWCKKNYCIFTTGSIDMPDPRFDMRSRASPLPIISLSVVILSEYHPKHIIIIAFTVGKLYDIRSQGFRVAHCRLAFFGKWTVTVPNIDSSENGYAVAKSRTQISDTLDDWIK